MSNINMYFSSDEVEFLTDYIEEALGPVEAIAHENSSDDFHIDLAIIPPHNGANYYTVCSIGHGAQEFEGSYDSGRQEFVLFLPPYWNLMNEGFDQIENWWPISLLKYVCRMREYYCATELLDFGSPYQDCTFASAVFFAPCLLGSNQSLSVSLPSGKTIKFLQIVPVSASDVEMYDQCKTSVERYSQMLNIDIFKLLDKSLPASALNDSVLRHFQSVLKPQ